MIAALALLAAQQALPQVEQIAPPLPAPAVVEAEQPAPPSDATIAQLPPEPRAVPQPAPRAKPPRADATADLERAYATVTANGTPRARDGERVPALDPDTRGFLAAQINAATEAAAPPATTPAPTVPKVTKP